MFDNLIKHFVPDYEKVEDLHVRERYGTVCSIVSIICNAIMVIFKLIFGTITNSVAIISDGYNNLSDMGSNIATLFGFKLASKHPDAHHPYGHGRFEYITGMIISFLILFVGINSLKEAAIKIFKPEIIEFSWAAIVVLIVSILLKLWMGYFNRKIAKRIDSTALNAAASDSFNDVLLTTATLASLLISQVTSLPIDGVIGSVVSVLVLKAGVEIFIDTINPLLGMAPDKELVNAIVKHVKEYPVVLGIHDLMLHDYGPGRRYMSMHVEVDASDDIMDIHDQIDVIERDLLENFNILTSIHMDPIKRNDELTHQYKKMVIEIVKSINTAYSIHDFRVVVGTTHTNLIFDVLLPAEDETDHLEIERHIKEEVKRIDAKLCCVMQIEHSYV